MIKLPIGATAKVVIIAVNATTLLLLSASFFWFFSLLQMVFVYKYMTDWMSTYQTSTTQVEELLLDNCDYSIQSETAAPPS